MMTWRRERRLEDLYDTTVVIRKPKITSVLRGSYGMQGPVHESEQDIEKITLSSYIDKTTGKYSMKRKAHTRAESGTCNVCSAPCSSCMHRKLSCMGSKSGEFSDETCHVTAASQNSINEDVALPFRNSICSTLQHTNSEASNRLSVNSSHISLSENEENKANTMCSGIADASGESGMLQDFPFGENVATNLLSLKPQFMLDRKTLLDSTKVVEGHGDNSSCISRANDASTTVTLRIMNVDEKNVSCSPVLFSSLGSEDSRKVLISPKRELSDTPSSCTDVGNSSSKVHDKCLSLTSNDTNMEEDVKLDSSKVSSQIHPGIDVEVKKESEDQLKENFRCSNQAEQDLKSNDLVDLPNMQEHALKSVSGDETSELDIMEHDVKVCDICGDAGREDLLAICSKCSDGAEHTYCMREMLRKVPEGDWLCEECKLVEEKEIERLKQAKADVGYQNSDVEGKIANRDSTLSSWKRRAEIEMASASKRHAIESSFGSPKSTSAVSGDSSFKGSEKGKVKPAHQNSFANRSGMDSPETLRSSCFGPRLQTSKGGEGTLLKSNSFSNFNSKPKVKLVDEVPQKQKGSRDLDVKEGTARMMSKSMSFKSMNSGRPIVPESKVKMLSSKFSQAQDSKGLKQVKDRNTLENKSLSKLDRPLSGLVTSSNSSASKVNQKLTPRGESAMVSFSCNNRESKASQTDGKSGSLLRSTSSLFRKGADIPASSARSLSTNGINNAAGEQKLNQVSPKGEPSSFDRPSNNVDDNSQDGLSRSHDSTLQNDQTKESSVNHSRLGVIAGTKGLACQKCKEIGHTAEFCSVAGPRTSGIDACSAKSVGEDKSKSSKLKAAIEAAMLKKPGLFRKKKESDQADGLSSNVGATFEDEQRDEGPANIGSIKQINNNSTKQLTLHSTDAFVSFKAGVTDSVIPSSVGKADAALTSNPLLSMGLTIPEHEYVWQGAIEVCRGGILDLYNGIQAHLSTSASPKVLDAVNQFPHKIIVDEVPRLSTWPRKFHDCGAKEDSIALYFFAKDFESYEKSYKNLLDNMIRRDLALKVSFDGVDFLIFPSTQLPENSQRWNMLFFLWGVFWGRRPSCSDLLTKTAIHGPNGAPLDINPAENQCTNLNGDLDYKCSITQMHSEQQNDRSNSKYFSKNATNSELLCSESRCSVPPQEEVSLPECGLDAEHKPSTQTTGACGGPDNGVEAQKHADASCVREDSASLQTGKQHEAVNVIVDDEKLVDRIDIDRDEAKVETNLNEDPPGVDTEVSSGRDATIRGLDCWQSDSRKRPHLDLSEQAPQTLSSTSQKLPWVIVDDTEVDGESNSNCKKPKTVFHERYGCSSISFSSQICDLGSSSLVEGQSCEKPADEKVIHEDLGTTARYFFPVESYCRKDIQMAGNSVPWKECSSIDENQFHDVVPSLELALGAESKTQNKGTVPFFVGKFEKNNTQNKTEEKIIDKEQEDGVSASLSLSLSFPFPDKEQASKSVSKTEQLLPERHRIDTSLLLFRGLSDK